MHNYLDNEIRKSGNDWINNNVQEHWNVLENLIVMTVDLLTNKYN